MTSVTSASVVSIKPLPHLLDGVLTLRVISSGAYGTVYLGRDSARRELAVKEVSSLIPLEAQAREREGLECYLEKFQSGGDHLLGIHQISPSGEQLRYSMELADNMNDPNTSDDYEAASLDALVKRFGALRIGQVVDWMHQLLDGISELHGKGLIHRDIKPGNIYFVHGRLKIGDLGLVTQFEADSTLIGTREYIPDDLKQAAPDMDIFAAGKILYTMITGLGANEYPRIPERLMDDAAVVALNRFIMERACSADPGCRFGSVSAFREAFDSVCDPASRMRKRQQRLHKAFIGTQIVFVLALIAWLWVLVWKMSAPKSLWPEGYIPVRQAWFEQIPPTDSAMRYRFGVQEDAWGSSDCVISPEERISGRDFEIYVEASSKVSRARLTFEFLGEDGTLLQSLSCVLTPRGAFSETTVLDGEVKDMMTWGMRVLPIDGEVLLLANGRPVLEEALTLADAPWRIRVVLASEEDANDGSVKLSRLCVFAAVK